MRDDALPTALDKASSPLGALLLPCQNARTHVVDGFTVVEFHGDIDLATVPEVRAHLDAATLPLRPQVIVDLRPALFFDCSALSLMCRARRRVLERAGSLALVCTRPWHLQVLEMAGLSAAFRTVATVEDARADALRNQEEPIVSRSV
ncbi:anti-sigma factor antagonist [Actinacidiphila soli]|jgi:anti-anti-sigma factor|uniref:anti-sigma factor antagonist n=1 Tax=Actinacidiphila soli TaxID=2487275 RepID=UPI000FC9B936|nr:anti-sigma factor antagonist [Actinacidiphila soli]